MKWWHYLISWVVSNTSNSWLCRILLFSALSITFGFIQNKGGQLIFGIGLLKAEIQITLIIWDKIEIQVGKPNRKDIA